MCCFYKMALSRRYAFAVVVVLKITREQRVCLFHMLVIKRNTLFLAGVVSALVDVFRDSNDNVYVLDRAAALVHI